MYKRQDLDDGIDTIGKKMTVCQLYAKYIRQRGNVKRGTKTSRKQFMDLLSEDTLGATAIENVKLSDAKEWAIRMKEKGFSFQSISNYKRSLRAAFFIAIEDDCVRKNPFSFALNKVLEDNRGEKNVLTPEQEVSLIDFVQNDKVYRKYVDEPVSYTHLDVYKRQAQPFPVVLSITIMLPPAFILRCF